MKTLFAALILCLLAAGTRADSIWDYQGNTMAGCGCALTGSLTLDGAGSVTAWDFTDGTHTLTQADSTIDVFLEANDFATWKLRILGGGIVGNGEYFFTQFYGSAFESSDAAYGAFENGSEGSWTDPPTATPEPRAVDTLLLFLMIAAIVKLIPVPKGMRVP